MIDSVPVWREHYKFQKMLNSPSPAQPSLALLAVEADGDGSRIVICSNTGAGGSGLTNTNKGDSSLLSLSLSRLTSQTNYLVVWRSGDNYIYCDTRQPGRQGQTFSQQAAGRRCLNRARCGISRQQKMIKMDAFRI